MKYETNIFSGDFSHGTFMDGEIEVDSIEEYNKILNKFLNEGEIELYENIGKYIENTLANEKSIIMFDIKDKRNHRFGDGFIEEDNGYKYYYWLKLFK